ncbi:MAG: CNNM domain-containing protein, partial [Pirellulaceae bacterium]
MVVTYLLLACLLVMLNGFFDLAEFAAVKMRTTRIKEWLDAQRPGATYVQHVHDPLD